MLALAAIAALAVTMVRAADPGSGGIAPPTDEMIINACGTRLVKVFAKFGQPSDLYPYRGDTTDKDGVTMDYGLFTFSFRDKIIRSCFFWQQWTGTIKGIKMGDSRQDVEKALGTNHQTDKADAVSAGGDYGFDLKDLGVTLWFDFDQNDKVNKVEVQLN
jgi:hypothetical protein